MRVPGFTKRLQDYMVKATREARVHTKWTRSPGLRHEQALIRFIIAIATPSKANVFLRLPALLWGDCLLRDASTRLPSS